MILHTKPKGMREKTLTRIELAVRISMLNLGYTDGMIARHIGMTPGAFSVLKRTNVYKQVYSQYLTGVVAPLDNQVRDHYKLGRTILRESIPIALQNLAMAAAQKLDKKLQMEASKELLDREGTFAKVSRVGIPMKEQGGFADHKDNETANELLKSLASMTKAEHDEAKPPTIESEPPTAAIN